MSGPVRVAHVATTDVTHRYLLLPQLRALRDAGYDVTAISAPGPFVPEIEAEGIRHLAWSGATRGWDLRADLRALGSLVRILRRERFDLVQTHNPKPGVLGRVAARVARTPAIVNTVHGLYATPQDRFPRRAAVLGAEWLAARCSHLELYQSEEDLDWARRARIVPAHRSALLGNGIDLRAFDPAAVSQQRVAALRRELGIAPEAVVVGAVGRLVAEKGYRELFEATRAVRAARPEVVFLVVGDPDDEKWDAITAEEMAASGEHVLFAGWRNDVRELLALMEVFVLASWREGMPRSAIEAAAMGKAMVLTDIRGCREVARDQREALLVPPRDPARLAQAIERLVEDAGLRSHLGAAARARACERFDEQRVIGVVLDRTAALTGGRALTIAEGSRGIRLRPARATDTRAIARLHRAVYTDAFLPKLGEAFLRRLYLAHIEDPGSVVLVLEQQGRVIGYTAGALSLAALRARFLRRYGLSAGVAIAPRLARPGIARRFFESARYPEATRALPDPELAFIAVAPEHRSKGLGRVLGRELVAALAERGASEVKAFVGADNAASNRMFERIGFERRGDVVVHDARPSNVWVIRCASLSRSA